MSGTLELVRSPGGGSWLRYPCCDGCNNEFHPSQLRPCVVCQDAGDTDHEYCESCRVECDDCDVTVCGAHAKGKVCQRCATIGYESAAGDGGESSGYRDALINAGRGNLLGH